MNKSCLCLLLGFFIIFSVQGCKSSQKRLSDEKQRKEFKDSLAVNRIKTMAAELLGTENEPRRYEIVNALAGEGSLAIKPAAAIVMDDKNKKVWSYAIDILVKIGGDEACNELAGAYHNMDDIFGRMMVLDGLSRLGKGALPVIEEALGSDEWMVRRNAVRALKALESDEAVDKLISALNDENELVRREAATGLLKDKDPYIRASALRAMAKIGTEEAFQDILPLARDTDKNVRFTLYSLLAEKNRPFNDIFKEGLKDEDLRIVNVSAYALAKKGEKIGLEILVKNLSHKKENVAEEAERYLSQATGHNIYIATDCEKLSQEEIARRWEKWLGE